jgi:catechol 2,3-dioxygenase-like lactoylglutathione lyase family enzyme
LTIDHIQITNLEHQMALLGLHHIHLSVPDFDASAAFLHDFGFHPAGQNGDRQYFRTSGANTYSVVLEPAGKPGLVAFAFEVESADDLARAVKQHGATPPQALQGPGGGSFVNLTDPDGKTISLVHGVARRAVDQPVCPYLEVNYGNIKPRKGSSQNFVPPGPAQLLRMGHVGLFTIDMARSDQWYREVLGLIPSDVFYAGKPDNLVAGFYRIDRGDEYVDHHTVALFGFGKNDLHHVSFEVQDSEAQFMSHRWLKQRQYESVWGVGRHPKGSHVFDLWREPSGYRFETFSDTDLCTAEHKAGVFPIQEQEMDLWLDQSHEPYFA